MLSPDAVEQETRRLEALARYDVLDTPAEPAYDRITELVARLFRAPVAGLSLIDESRQWFKSRRNLDVCETTRASAFCARTIESDEVFVVPDASASSFAEYPGVRDGSVRFYAGAPLRTHDGYRIGALWFCDPQPRPALDADEKQTLLDLAATVMSELELRLSAARLAAAHQREARLERLAATGTLAAAIGHEINNPLASVAANARVIAEVLDRGALDGDSRRLMRETVADVIEGAARIRNVTRALHSLVGAAQPVIGSVDLREVIESATTAVAPALARRVRIENFVPPQTLVCADRALLVHAMSSLLTNAAEAMPEGRIGRVSARAGRTGGDITLEVRDDGRGMPEAVLARAFNPFFTTKAVGEGMGLGLSICHSFVRSFGGEIAVDSREGEGSTFRVRIPAGAGRTGETPQQSCT